MSQSQDKKQRKWIRRNYRLQYLEFLKLTEKLDWKERLRISWAVLFKLGSVEERRKKRYLKKNKK